MYLITGPLKLTVELKAKDVRGTKAGLYILGPTKVNGKSYWLQDSEKNAIWYLKPNGDWRIGHQDGIGNSSAAIGTIYTTEDVAGPQEATTWQHYSGGKWNISDDILVDTVKTGIYINRMRIM
mgnify:CR=1 FL=1